MAGELSLMSALTAGHLVRAHLAHNRSQLNTPMPSRPHTPGPETAEKQQFPLTPSSSEERTPAAQPSGYVVEAK